MVLDELELDVEPVLDVVLLLLSQPAANIAQTRPTESEAVFIIRLSIKKISRIVVTECWLCNGRFVGRPRAGLKLRGARQPPRILRCAWPQCQFHRLRRSEPILSSVVVQRA